MRAYKGLLSLFTVLTFVAGCQTREPSSAQGIMVPPDVGKARLASTCGPDVLEDPLGLKPTPGCTHLVFSGAAANFPRIAVWILQGMAQRSSPATFRGDVLFIGGRSEAAPKQIGEGLAHVAVISPSAVGYMAYKGIGMFSKAYPNLRGLFKLPQRDLVTLAVRADLGVKSFDEVIQKKIPLKVTTGLTAPERTIGSFLFPELMKAYGSSVQELESWGGKMLRMDVRGESATDKIEAGEANAIFNEGVIPISPAWKKLHEKIPMQVLSIRDDVIEKLGLFGFKKYDQPIRKGKYPGVAEDITTIDWSDWIVIADVGVPDDIAYKMAQIGVEDKEAFESQYPDMLPIGSRELGQYVADPKEMWKDLGIPLHPGAERYFKEKGLMP